MPIIKIRTRYYGSAFIARGGGISASSTSAERTAVDRVVLTLSDVYRTPVQNLTCLHECHLSPDEGWVPGEWHAILEHGRAE